MVELNLEVKKDQWRLLEIYQGMKGIPDFNSETEMLLSNSKNSFYKTPIHANKDSIYKYKTLHLIQKFWRGLIDFRWSYALWSWRVSVMFRIE